MENIEFCGYKYTYTGMVHNDTNKPDGFGRAISTNKNLFIDAQVKDGIYHGYIRYIN